MCLHFAALHRFDILKSMASPKLVVGVLGITAITLLVAVLVRESPEPAPVVVWVVSVEPSGIYDDAGEMWLMTLRINDTRRGRGEAPIYIEDNARPEARVVDRWSPIDTSAGSWLVLNNPEMLSHEVQLAVPLNTDSCRLNLKWAQGRLVSGRLWKFAEDLTAWPRARTLLFKLARGGGYPRYAPSSQWHEFTVELPLSAVKAAVNSSLTNSASQ